MSAARAALLSDADRALAAQDFARAAALFEEAAKDGDDPSILLRLAGAHRACGRPRVALDAVHRALALAPLDFTALMLRASLLERMGDPNAGEAWGHAIAQKPVCVCGARHPGRRSKVRRLGRSCSPAKAGGTRLR